MQSIILTINCRQINFEEHEFFVGYEGYVCFLQNQLHCNFINLFVKCCTLPSLSNMICYLSGFRCYKKNILLSISRHWTPQSPFFNTHFLSFFIILQSHRTEKNSQLLEPLPSQWWQQLNCRIQIMVNCDSKIVYNHFHI